MNIIDFFKDVLFHKALLKFKQKNIVIELSEEMQCLELSESDGHAKLKKLKFLSRKSSLKDGHHDCCLFIQLDHKAESENDLSLFTHFINKHAENVTSKCDFLIIVQENNRFFILISEMKSSEKGLNERCDRQFFYTEKFVRYLVDLSVGPETQSPEVSYHRIVFIPVDHRGVALPESLTPDPNNAINISIENNYLVVKLEDVKDGLASIDTAYTLENIKRELCKKSDTHHQET